MNYHSGRLPDETPSWEATLMKYHPRGYPDEIPPWEATLMKYHPERLPWWNTFLRGYPDEIPPQGYLDEMPPQWNATLRLSERLSWWNNTLSGYPDEIPLWEAALMKYHRVRLPWKKYPPLQWSPWWNTTLMWDHCNERPPWRKPPWCQWWKTTIMKHYLKVQA